MIGDPVNDLDCLAKITAVAQQGTTKQSVRNLAASFSDTEELARWIRSLPQRNDIGDADDGPRVDCGAVSQRVRLDADDPNCVERSALYLAVAESIDPEPLRQLATLRTPAGLHTFPVEDDLPVILDPGMARNALDAGLYQIRNQAGYRPVTELPPRELVQWVAQIAEEPAMVHRNGPARVRRGRQAMLEALEGKVRNGAAEDVGFTLMLASDAARLFGGDGTAAVRMASLAMQRMLTSRASQPGPTRNEQPRNLSLRIPFTRSRIGVNKKAFSGIGRITKRVATPLLGTAARAFLASKGFPPQVIDALERELQKENLTLGPVAAPPPIPGSMAAFTQTALSRRTGDT